MAQKTFGSPHKRAKRGKVSGWSPGAARRNVAFLRSVDERELSGVGLAFTLTLKHCPPTVAAWKSALKAWIDRQRRGGMIRLHWVMEFQRRGVPHLHVAAWYDADQLRPGDPSMALSLHDDAHEAGSLHVDAATRALADWLDVASAFGARGKGQQARALEGPIGWFVYMSKHCGRGRQHYQRQQESQPEAWESSPRVWGHRGDWTREEPAVGELTQRQWYVLRRLIRRQRVARARASVPGPGWSWAGDALLDRQQLRDAAVGPAARTSLRTRLRHLQQARAMLRCPDRSLSEVRGVSEWIEPSQQEDLMRAVLLS